MRATRERALGRLAAELAPGEWRVDEATRRAHAGDKWFAAHLPEAVAFPRDAASVGRILRLASRHGIPVTARGFPSPARADSKTQATLTGSTMVVTGGSPSKRFAKYPRMLPA